MAASPTGEALATPTSPALLRTVGAALADAQAALRPSGVPSPRLDVLLLVGHVLGATKADLLAHPERLLDAEQAAALATLVARRAAREPLAYLLGQREFYGRDFLVTPDVLVPRPETELLVELALNYLRRGPMPADRKIGWAADVGTGSGALAVTLAAEHGDLRLLAVDRSLPALRVARENALRESVADRVHLLQGDLLASFRSPFGLIVANLPYIPTATIDTLMPEVAHHEPREALDGGPDGLALNRRLLAQAPALLAPGGLLLLEMGGEQGDVLMAAARASLPTADVTVVKDLAGHNRVLRVQRP